jgi:hypothetical protein
LTRRNSSKEQNEAEIKDEELDEVSGGNPPGRVDAERDHRVEQMGDTGTHP